MQDWIKHFLTLYRSTPCLETNKCPAELIFKTKPRTKLEILRPIMEYHKEIDSIKMQVFKEEYIWCRLKMYGEKKGNWLKGKILKVINVTTYLVEVDSKVKFVHINKLRKAFEVVDNTNSRLTDNDKKI